MKLGFCFVEEKTKDPVVLLSEKPIAYTTESLSHENILFIT